MTVLIIILAIVFGLPIIGVVGFWGFKAFGLTARLMLMTFKYIFLGGLISVLLGIKIK